MPQSVADTLSSITKEVKAFSVLTVHHLGVPCARMCHVPHGMELRVRSGWRA